MNFHKLGAFIIAGGVAVFMFGGFQYIEADHVAVNAVHQAAPMGMFGAALVGMDAEAKKQMAQEGAKKFLAAGAVIIFIGYALVFSAKEGSGAGTASGDKTIKGGSL